MQEKQKIDSQPGAVQRSTYTVAEVQTMLGCSREVVYDLLNKKVFRWVRIGAGKGVYRISRESFDAWLNNQS